MSLFEQKVLMQAVPDGLANHAHQALTATEFASCDGNLGPWAIGCQQGRFDFTFSFEQIFLAIIPSALFITVSSVRIWSLIGLKPQVKATVMVHLKLVACCILIAFKIVSLVQVARVYKNLPLGNASLAAAALDLADATILTVASQFEHTRSMKPSTIISTYMAVSAIFDIIKCRTLFLIRDLTPLLAMFAAGTITKIVILCLETRNKRSALIQDWRKFGPESTLSAFNSIFLWWVNAVLWRGHNSPLKLPDLPALEPEFRGKHLLPIMLQEWEKRKETGKHALLWTLASTTKAAIVACAIPRIILSVCKLVMPSFVARVIAYVANYDTSEDGVYRQNMGYTLIAATAILFVTRTLVEVAHEQAKTRMKVMTRSALTSIILHYAAQLEPGEKQGSVSLTLITADASRAVTAFNTVHELWITPIEVLLATWLLTRQVGLGSVGPIVTVFMGIFISGYMSKLIGPAQLNWLGAIQRRISDTTTILGSMRETKMLGLVDSYTSSIQNLLENELAKSVAFRKLLSVLNAAGGIPDSFAPPITFGLAILFSGGTRLSISEAFTSISILGLIVGPLARLTHTFPFTIAALPSFARMQEFISSCSAYEADVSLRGASTELTSCETNSLLPELEHPLFAMENANILAKSSSEPIISNANMKILPKTFNIIAGKVATGKTTLLRALLGQLKLSGSAQVRTSNIAYCPQTPWLISGTAKQNIVGKSEPDEAWYQTVVAACGLDRDFRDLPRGDSTAIGSKGVSLSGGQKLRIALARGIFSRKPIMFVDDVLSGLDWTTQRHVWTRVFGASGLLRKNGVTVVLATHTLHLVELADTVILLGDKAAGSMIQGTMTELKEKTKIADLISTSHGGSDNSPPSETGATATKETKLSGKTATVDDAEADLLRKTGDASLYLYYWKTVGWRGLIGFLSAAVLCAGWPILPQIWLLWWTEANETSIQVNTQLYFWVFTVLNIGKTITVFIAVYYCMVVFAPKGLRVLHSRLLQTAMSAPLSFFATTAPGDLVNRFSGDISQIDVQLPMSMFTSFMALLALFRAIGLVMFGSLYMGVAIIPMLIFVYLLQKFYLKTSRQLRYLELQSCAPLNTHLIETIDGAATIQAFGWQEPVRADGLAHLDESTKPYYMLSIIQNWLELVMGLFVSAVSTLLITTCVALPDSTSTGGIALSLTNLLALGSALSFFITSWTNLETSLGAAERLRTFEETTPKETTPSHQINLPDNWPHRGAIHLNSITASYRNSHDARSTRVLDNISFQIQPGQKVAICGRTGSGKSSLLLAFFQLLELEKGSIVVDEVDLTNIPPNILRSKFIAVPQEPTLLPGTLRANLCPVVTGEDSSHADDETLIGCLKVVGLWDELERQGGLDSQVSDLELSHGQKQLVCMARAVANKNASSILVLDEAMSSVDKHTEQLMVKILEEQFSRHTIISVVHRLNTITEFDEVLLLESGVVVETGSPTALLRSENGRFRALWENREIKEDN